MPHPIIDAINNSTLGFSDITQIIDANKGQINEPIMMLLNIPSYPLNCAITNAFINEDKEKSFSIIEYLISQGADPSLALKNTTLFSDLFIWTSRRLLQTDTYALLIKVVAKLISCNADPLKPFRPLGTSHDTTPLELSFFIQHTGTEEDGNQNADELIKMLIEKFEPEKYNKDLIDSLRETAINFDEENYFSPAANAQNPSTIDDLPFTKALIKRGMKVQFKESDHIDDTERLALNFYNKRLNAQHRWNFIVSVLAGFSLIYPLIIFALYLIKLWSFKPGLLSEITQDHLEFTQENQEENCPEILNYGQFSIFYEYNLHRKLGVHHTLEGQEQAIPSATLRSLLLS